MGVFNWHEQGRERAVGEAANGQPVVVSRARHVLAPPDAVFAVLADPAALAGLLPRVKKVELLEQGDGQARIATHMQITPFNTVRSEGEVRWQGTREIVFRTLQPAGVETRLELRPTATGTNVYATLALDLAPMLGPLAAFVPHDQVAGAAGPDLDATLNAIARAVEKS
jgi:carbon monoxide dehydrogenase subunit G